MSPVGFEPTISVGERLLGPATFTFTFTFYKANKCSSLNFLLKKYGGCYYYNNNNNNNSLLPLDSGVPRGVVWGFKTPEILKALQNLPKSTGFENC